MLDVTYEVILGKLNRICHDSFLKAMRLAKAGGHATVEPIHWLVHLVNLDRTDVSLTLDHFRIDRGKVLSELQQALADIRQGRSEAPDISDGIDEVLKDAWHYATLMFGELQVRSGHVLLAMLRSRRVMRTVIAAAPSLRALSADAVAAECRSVWSQSEEENLASVDGASLAPASAPGEPATQRAGTALARFASDLTAEAASGKMDPIVGRDHEIRQVIDVLMRRRQNNPILTGEAGVGKTAVVEGFAQKIVAGEVPDVLKGVRVHALDIGLLSAGASMKGEFEQRLRSVIDEVQASPTPIILFIDEAHTLIGAGGQAGTGDAANLLKPALARGTLRTVAATTWAEYRRYFEKDPALTRRFQPVAVDEPDIAKACAMIRGIVGPMQSHHKVRIADDAVVAAVTLSKRYIPARQLPDKAVSLLDTASARVAISQATRPPALADVEAQLADVRCERSALDSDRELGADRAARIAEVDEEIAALDARRTALEAEWAEERALVADVLALRAGGDASAAGGDLTAALARLERLDPERRRMYAHVDAQAIASVVSDWTGIPVGRMVRNEVETVLNLAKILGGRVIGQSHGLEMIARRIETSRAKLDNPNKPIGVFMLCGPSGVGKTETALTLAENLYGGEQNVITINMSEFQEAHTVSTLKGAPPGYVGYGEGGRLTEAVRRKPFSVVLLDEVEKAHPDVHELFFQVFDKGQMEDGTGRMIDFRNTIILLTSNVGTDLIAGLSRDPHFRAHPEELAVELRGELLKVFPAALIGRMVVIPYFPLADDVLAGIVRLQLDRVVKRVREQGARFVYDDAVVEHIVALCNDPDSGGRMIDNIITNSLLPTLAQEFLRQTLHGGTLEEARVTAQDGRLVFAYNGAAFPAPTVGALPEDGPDAGPDNGPDGGPTAPAAGPPPTDGAHGGTSGVAEESVRA